MKYKLIIHSFFNSTFRDTRRQYNICIDNFRRVINALEELSVLKIRFNLTLTFDDYMNVSFLIKSDLIVNNQAHS